MTKTYAVSYEGWLVIEAEDESSALTKAHEILSNSEITNDGELGEWELADVEEEEGEF